MTTYGDPASSPVLIWHGRGPNERDVLDALARMVADLGHSVFVPDWDSTADGGYADLTTSLDTVRAASVETAGLLLVGWSLGGTAATSVAFGSHGVDRGIRAVVGLAADPRARDRITGARLAASLMTNRLASQFGYCTASTTRSCPSRTAELLLTEPGPPARTSPSRRSKPITRGSSEPPMTSRYDDACLLTLSSRRPACAVRLKRLKQICDVPPGVVAYVAWG